MNSQALNQAEINQQEWENAANWRGLFYFGRRDNRMSVRKRRGYGWTLNFARPLVQIISAAVVIGIGVAIVLTSF